MSCLQNDNHLKLFSLITLLSVALCPIETVVAEKVKPQALDIQARYMLLDENKGISTYKGKVILKKDTLVIKADSMTLYFNGEKLNKVSIIGSPADVRHAPDNEAKVHSQARKMEYLVNEDKLTLMGQAFVNQGNRHFSGEAIEYDTRQRIISAAGKNTAVTDEEETSTDSTTNQRVHVIIGPETENNDAISNDSEN
jgi:lipopolysaccharide export system protein LptA